MCSFPVWIETYLRVCNNFLCQGFDEVQYVAHVDWCRMYFWRFRSNAMLMFNLTAFIFSELKVKSYVTKPLHWNSLTEATWIKEHDIPIALAISYKAIKLLWLILMYIFIMHKCTIVRTETISLCSQLKCFFLLLGLSYYNNLVQLHTLMLIICLRWCLVWCRRTVCPEARTTHRPPVWLYERECV